MFTKPQHKWWALFVVMVMVNIILIVLGLACEEHLPWIGKTVYGTLLTTAMVWIVAVLSGQSGTGELEQAPGPPNDIYDDAVEFFDECESMANFQEEVRVAMSYPAQELGGALFADVFPNYHTYHPEDRTDKIEVDGLMPVDDTMRQIGTILDIRQHRNSDLGHASLPTGRGHLLEALIRKIRDDDHLPENPDDFDPKHIPALREYSRALDKIIPGRYEYLSNTIGARHTRSYLR